MSEAIGDGAHREVELGAIEGALRASGPGAALDTLLEIAARSDDPRDYLDALLLKARHDLGLPLIAAGPLSSMPEPARTQYEERYIAALRQVGQAVLDRGDVITAWPFFRAIGEKDAIAAALEATAALPGDERVGAWIDIGLYQGANPKRGFQLVLEQYGTCSAISAFEQLPGDEGLRGECAGLLLHTLHAQLAANLRGEIERAGKGKLSEETPIPALLAGRDWLFEDDSYHIDISHLASVVRMSPLLSARAELGLARELCEYGRRLAPRLRYDDVPPFEKTYEDHGAYLDALLGRDVEASLDHFRAKLEAAEQPEDALAVAQVLVRLLDRLGRVDDAISVAEAHLAEVPEGALSCPSLPRLCDRAGRLDRLAEVARRNGQIVNFTAARLGAHAAGG